METLIAFWSHALAAALFLALAFWRLRRCCPPTGAAPACGCVRNDGVLGMARRSNARRTDRRICRKRAQSPVDQHALQPFSRQRAGTWAEARLWRGCRRHRAAVDRRDSRVDPAQRRPRANGPCLRITTAAGALVLVHNVYGQAAPASRSHIRLAMLGLALIWTYDLNLYTIAYLGSAMAHRWVEWGGLPVALAAPMFALASSRRERMALSPVARGDVPVALAAGDLRLFRADGDRRDRVSRIGFRLVRGAAGCSPRGR